ncbi:reverse transcriptase domain-containing protein [Tanacetum coccineum]|uniref:Reverse transcriptase domain-containing protein n=1 Tax=Tanacetum coccineum TaxID=301880 RepID=A0ABQ5BZN0_9ASTR
MAVVFAFEKFRSYLVRSKTIVHTDRSALRHLFKKQDAKPRLIRWILLLLEFDIEIKDRKGIENVAADHLSRIENEETSDDSEVDDNFPRETLMKINTEDKPWFTDFANYLASDIIPKGMTYQQKKKKSRTSNTTSGRSPTSSKYVSTHVPKDRKYIKNMMKALKLHSIVVEYVSKWAEAQVLPTNDVRVVITFPKKLSCRFGMPKALISDRGTHFCNNIMEKTMKRYAVNPPSSLHPYQPSNKVSIENTNRALKRILKELFKEQSQLSVKKLDDA